MTHATPIKAGRKRFRARLRGQRTMLCVGLLVLFFVVVYFVLPPPGGGFRAALPVFFQRLVGLACALLAMVTAMFAVREYGRGYNRLHLPAVGSVRTSILLGALAFLAVLAWWFSPWAPIEPLFQAAADLAKPLFA
jgi:hypothetical protein